MLTHRFQRVIFPLAFGLLSLCHVSFAQGTRATTSLEVQAGADIENDQMTVVLSATKEGPRAQELSQSVLAIMQRAIARAKRAEAVTPSLGNISTYPVWGPQGKKTENWTVRANLVLVSKNFAALGALASELTDELQITSVAFNLSKEKRTQEEKRLLAELSESFREKAQAVTQAFGYRSYEIKSLNLNQNSSRGIVPPMRLAMASAAAESPAVPIPSDGGKTTVTIGVQATIDVVR